MTDMWEESDWWDDRPGLEDLTDEEASKQVALDREKGKRRG
jgi:hypothetical protein